MVSDDNVAEDHSGESCADDLPNIFPEQGNSEPGEQNSVTGLPNCGRRCLKQTNPLDIIQASPWHWYQDEVHTPLNLPQPLLIYLHVERVRPYKIFYCGQICPQGMSAHVKKRPLFRDVFFVKNRLSLFVTDYGDVFTRRDILEANLPGALQKILS